MLRRLVALMPGDDVAAKADRLASAIRKSALDMGEAENDPMFASAWRVEIAVRSGEIGGGATVASSGSSGSASTSEATAAAAADFLPSAFGDNCSICLAKKRTHALVPCGHRCLCSDCTCLDSLGYTCPICRRPAHDTLRVWDP